MLCPGKKGGTDMAKNKHLTQDNRYSIQNGLNDRLSFAEIGRSIDKDPTTISKEIRSHLIYKRVGSMHQNYNACANRSKCNKSHICVECKSDKNYKLCRSCYACNKFCPDFAEYICPLLLKKPYVCNGCKKRYYCTLEKRYYFADKAQLEYKNTLSESRSGISFSEDEIFYLDSIISPLIKQGQSPHHVCITNPDTIMVSERTVYRLIDCRAISAMNIDLPRKVRFSARKNPIHKKVDKACRINRDYQCFLDYMEKNSDIPIVELDSVEGKKGSAVLLTIHFVKSEMMLAFLREHNDSQSVIDIFNDLYIKLGTELFKKIFAVCLADNGSEFSNPSAIEKDSNDNERCHVFYCNPSAPYQKGSAERNHEFIREFIPQGKDLAIYSQDDISLMMDHINSYARKSIGDKTPYEVFSFMYGEKVLDLLRCHPIPPQEVTLNKSIFSKEEKSDD